MKKNLVTLLASATISAILAVSPAMAEAETEALSNSASVISNNAVNDGYNMALADPTASLIENDNFGQVFPDAAQSETVVPEENVSDVLDPFVEGSALLSDYNYVPGELTEEGWKSAFLGMQYVPDRDVVMGLEQNDKIQEYHLRNGEDKQVGINELIALGVEKSYAQMMVEVNPNAEEEEDLIERFKENEEIELSTEVKETKIAGKTFLATTGIRNHEKYMLAVSTDVDNFVIAVIVKYDVAATRRALLRGFMEYKEEETEAVSEAEEQEAVTEKDADDELLPFPEEFEDAKIMDGEEPAQEETAAN